MNDPTAGSPERSPFSLLAAALRDALRRGYGAADLRADVLAGLVVGVVALPLSMALAIAVNVPPQHGLYTAIVGGALVALLGGSRCQVTGPTAAFIVILAPIQAAHGTGGLLVAGAMAGVILIVLGLTRLGQLVSYIPHPVTTGFTAGIGTVIATFQLKDLLGLQLDHPPDHFHARVLAMADAIGTTNPSAVGLGLGTLGLLLLVPRFTKKIPAPLVALTAITLVALALERLVPGFQVDTIGSRFSYLDAAGHAHAGIPQLPPAPMLPWLLPGPDGRPLPLTLETLRALLPAAFAIALLGAIESLLSAVVADGMAGTRHDPDAELLALGIGNLVCPFFGGIAATGAIARTATNIRYGARSPLAAVTHAVVILAAVVVAAPLLAHLPMAALAGLLVLVAWNMSDVKHFMHIVRVAPRSDILVLLTCWALTVLFDMVISVSVGIVLASLLFMRRTTELFEVKLLDRPQDGAHAALPPGVVLYQIAGPMFFGAAQKAMSALGVINASASAVIIDLHLVPSIDATGLVALESAVENMRKHKVLAVLAGAQPQVAHFLSRASIIDDPGRYVAVKTTVAEAITFLGDDVPVPRSARFKRPPRTEA